MVSVHETKTTYLVEVGLHSYSLSKVLCYTFLVNVFFEYTISKILREDRTVIQQREIFILYCKGCPCPFKI